MPNLLQRPSDRAGRAIGLGVARPRNLCQPGVNVLARHGMDGKEMARMGGFAKWAKVRSKRKRTEIMKRVRSGEKAGNQRKR